MKSSTYRKVALTIERSNGYGTYIISSNYRGKEIKVITHNSEAFDWLDDDSNKEKHQAAKKYCYREVREKWERLKEEEAQRKWMLKHKDNDLVTHLAGC